MKLARNTIAAAKFKARCLGLLDQVAGVHVAPGGSGQAPVRPLAQQRQESTHQRITRPAIAVAAYLAYFLIQEGLWSTTVGKWLFGLRVCYPDGSRCGWTAAAIRTALRVVEANPLLIGGLPAALTGALSRRHQRLGDMLARCLVTRDSPVTGGHALVRPQPVLEPKQ
jgi:hypothetical protein